MPMAQTVAQLQQSGLQWREAVVKIDNDTFMRVQYLFNQEISDYGTLANLVAAGQVVGRAWRIDAREYTGQTGVGYDDTDTARKAAARLLENASESEVVSRRSGIRTVTDTDRDLFRAVQDMMGASRELARDPHNQDAMARLADASVRLGRSYEAEQALERRRAEQRRAREEEAPPQPVAEAPPEERAAKSSAPKTIQPAGATAGAKSAITLETVPLRLEAPRSGERPRSLEFFTPDDREGVSYYIDISWKRGEALVGTYDPNDIWSIERFVFMNLGSIESFTMDGYVDGHLDETAAYRAFAGKSFGEQYARRVYQEVEGSINGQRACLYVPRGMEAGKTFEELLADPANVVAASVGERGRAAIVWSFASPRADVAALLDNRTRPQGGEVAQA